MSTSTTILYGIRKIGYGYSNPVTYTTYSVENPYCQVPVVHELDRDHYEGYPVWTVDTLEKANDVLHNSAHDISASYDTPKHSLCPEHYEVVKIETTTKLSSVV